MVWFVVMIVTWHEIWCCTVTHDLLCSASEWQLLAWCASASGPVWQWRSQGTWLPEDYTTQNIWQIPRPACFHSQTHQQYILQVSSSLMHKKCFLKACCVWSFSSVTPSKGSRWEDQGTKIVFFFSVCGGKKLETKLTAGILGKNKTKYTKG